MLSDHLSALRSNAAFMKNVTAWEYAPEVKPRFAPMPAQLHPALILALQQRGIEQLYTHQVAALTHVFGGRHTVVVASAAGGKSLCFQLPILDALLRIPNARALCLFPTKALAQDQLTSFRGLLENVNSGNNNSDGGAYTTSKSTFSLDSASINIYDGDTPQGQRADIRRDARVILSNADMLHIGILPHHPRWAAFFKNLRYVVIDEMHMYRGVFGSHVANVLRRLQRLCAFYGAKPIFILASATINNPRQHAENLIEAVVQLVPPSDDGSPHGEQNIIIVNPPIIAEQAAQGIRQNSLLVARDIALELLKADAQTICFARSRQDTELLLNYLQDHIKGAYGTTTAVVENGANKTKKTTASLPTIAGYRGGYLPEERRAIEAGLRAGKIRGVVATNALEVGIDIGDLDACVMHGYPGSIASFWQQAGRAGRRRNAAVAMMVATSNALDQYLAQHTQYLFSQSPEHARIAPNNLGVLAAHVQCAAFELPFVMGESLGSQNVDDMLGLLAESGELHASGGTGTLPLFPQTAQSSIAPTRFTWVGEGYPADQVSLRGVGEQISILDDEQRLIGQTERSTAHARVYVGAVYMHQGEHYLIYELDLDIGIARARRTSPDYYTRASVVSEVMIQRVFDNLPSAVKVKSSEDAPSLIACGEIEVVSRATRFRQIQFNTHHVLGTGDIDLPEQRLFTTGYWFSIPAETAKQLSKLGVIKLPNDYGPNWQKQRNAARARDGYRCCVCGKPESSDRQHDVHHKVPFRKYGYIAGENDQYIQANVLTNLMTVCIECHQRIETADHNPTGLDGLAYILSQMAPLLVMCDPSDLATVADWDSHNTKLPTITLYELTPGGMGFSEELYQKHTTLLSMCVERIKECSCERGCPACVGPPGETLDGTARNLKDDTLHLIATFDRIYNE